MQDKYFCRKCRGLRNHKSLFEKELKGEDVHDYFQWLEKYIIIECLGCETISFLKIYGNTEMIWYDDEGNREYFFNEDLFPLYLEKVDELKYKNLLPDKIRGIYNETISAFKTNSYILTAGGLRAIIEALCNHLKIKKDNLSNRIDFLHRKGHLTLSESKRLHSIRFLGNDALHEIEKPNKDHLYLLLELINHLLSNLFINDKILKGKVDTIIDTYEEFKRLVMSKLTEELIGKEITLSELIDKTKRLIPKAELSNFEKQLIKDLKANKLDYIELKKEIDNIGIYKILKVPSIFNFGLD
jgi:hypothetical protein